MKDKELRLEMPGVHSKLRGLECRKDANELDIRAAQMDIDEIHEKFRLLMNHLGLEFVDPGTIIKKIGGK